MWSGTPRASMALTLAESSTPKPLINTIGIDHQSSSLFYAEQNQGLFISMC